MAALDLPLMESMAVEDARAFYTQLSATRPTGPDVGEIVDGVLPALTGDLAYRLYRPPTPGPHPIVVYFHGGGWVVGDAISEDPLCRDLCVRTDAIVVSADYRHAPEHRFPAAVDDAMTAVQWIADNAEALGGRPGQLAVCGWSAGGNLAAAVCRLARDTGGPDIVAQALLAPKTDSDTTRSSYVENGDGYLLTTALVGWFLDHYADPENGATRGSNRYAQTISPGFHPRSWSPLSSTHCATRAMLMRPHCGRRASRPSTSVHAATHTTRSPWSTWSSRVHRYAPSWRTHCVSSLWRRARPSPAS